MILLIKIKLIKSTNKYNSDMILITPSRSVYLSEQNNISNYFGLVEYLVIPNKISIGLN